MRILAAVALSLAPMLAFAAEPAVKSPVSAEDSLKFFVLSPAVDLRIDLVAAEPEVVDPVAVAFDEQARMYVVEMRDYPNGPTAGQPPMSRVRLLEDMDGDGRYETAHDFAGGLLFATGVLPWDGGAIVSVAGEVRFLKDTDGDHKADVNEAWFSGFAEGNPQLRANHPTFGPDGWIYVANGLRGGKVKAVKEGWPQKEIELRDHDFRFDPRTGEAEAVTGGSQFGLTFDAFGNRFICSNRNPCDHVVLEDRDLARNPRLAIGKPTQVVAAAGEDSRVYPLVNAWTTSTLHAGQFTAACGVTIFTGDALPAGCVGNVFTCEPTGSLVHREVLEPVGGTFRGRPGEQKAEFLASRDPWFRPVNLTVGPDGALYVVDMYRAVIEHPDWVPEELKHRKDERWGDDRGRIYRVATKDRPPAKMPTLAGKAPMDLIDSLDTENGWQRETAKKRLMMTPAYDADDEKVWEDTWDYALNHFATDGKSAAGRVAATGILSYRGSELAPDAVFGLILQKRNRQLQSSGVRLLRNCSVAIALPGAGGAVPCGQEGWQKEALNSLANSDDARVRFEVALSLYSSDPNDLDALASIASRDSGDRWTRAAVLCSTEDPLALYDAIMKRDAGDAVPFLVDLAELVGRRREEKELAAFLSRLASTGPEGGWALPIFVGLGEGLGGSLQPALAVASDHDRRRMQAVFAWCAGVARNDAAPTPQRVQDVRVVALADPALAVPSLLALVDVPDQEVKLATVEAVGRFRGDARIAPALLEGFDGQTPAVRGAILDALLADPGRAAAVVEAVAAKELSASELGPARIAALSKSPDAAVRAKAAQVFAPPADRQKVIAEYGKVLSQSADARRGREVFAKNCATCHRIGDVGMQVGPDIADSLVRTPEALLTDILDPNCAIDGRYVAYTVALTDGTVQTGLIAGETGNAVTLAQPEGKMVTLLRGQIESLRSDGTSLMPVGVERTVPPQDMADLIAFIKNWRYLDGAVPLGE